MAPGGVRGNARTLCQAVVLAAVFAVLAPRPANADYGVISPDAIDYGELVIQPDGDVVYDRRSSTGGAQG